MTREDAKKYAEIMMAYADGKQIESKQYGVWLEIESPNFEWSISEYRVKEGTKYRPFKTIEEVEPYFMKKVINDNSKSIITGAFVDDGDLYIEVGSTHSVAEDFLENYIFVDGTLCGVIR